MTDIQTIQKLIEYETGDKVVKIIDYREAEMYVIITAPKDGDGKDYICDPYCVPNDDISPENLKVFLPFDDPVGKFSSLTPDRVIYNIDTNNDKITL